MVNGGESWYKNHDGKDDVKPDGSEVVELSTLKKTFGQSGQSIASKERPITSALAMPHDCMRNNAAGDLEVNEGVIDGIKNGRK
ncbi:hypothetical protein PILCRDRAFT_828045 [Piloderma croceum F 1598]|uniref:Uncharacterized protein n=1 Tax=Piloderma croceum (strain F 1598) TaxID=765440 RepID=A0A0C3AL72_PILCF|nr:hypothetical protein PILCRDRAFT_828045 [Piloderma croceum F 1598]